MAGGKRLPADGFVRVSETEGQSMIEVNGLVKRYGSHTAVKNASFKIDDGEIVGFLGPNGAGKSTTMNILTGYLSATGGTVKIDGFDILEDPREAKKRIGYLPEQPPLYIDMTVSEYLNFVYDLKRTTLPRKPHLAEISRLVKIDNVFNRLIRNLSKGYKQRVGIAQALIGNPDVLILDEPTVGLDPKQIIDIRNLIAQLGRTHTVILSSHILTEIEAVCERIIVINQGVLIADGTHEELSRHISEDMSLTAKIIGPARQVLSALQRLAGVKGARALGTRELGSTEFRIEPMPGIDVRSAIFDCAVAQGWKLLELTSNAMTLEEVFLKMVGQPPEEAVKLFGASGVELETEDSAEGTANATAAEDSAKGADAETRTETVSEAAEKKGDAADPAGSAPVGADGGGEAALPETEQKEGE